jgi:hypothetical protein
VIARADDRVAQKYEQPKERPVQQTNKHNRRVDEEIERQDESFLKGAPISSRVDERFAEQDLPLDSSAGDAAKDPREHR